MNDPLDQFYGKGLEKTKIKNEWYKQYDVKKGLRNEDGTGVLVGLTKIADVVGYQKVDGNKVDCLGKLYYRGLDIDEFMTSIRNEGVGQFEKTCFLLVFGYLPNTNELETFTTYLKNHYELSDDFVETKLLHMPGKNIMNRLQQAVLSLYDYDEKADDVSIVNTLHQGLNMLAKLPSIICYAYQSKIHKYNKASLVIHPVQPNLTIAENMLYMLRENHTFSELEAQVLDRMLILHADHGGGNNSTFTNVVISSTGTDIYSTMVGAIGSMKGPRHGGANLKVVGMMKEVIHEIGFSEDKEEIKQVIYKILHKDFYDHSGLVYGIGHAIYTLSDPRSVLIQKDIFALAKAKHREKEYAFYQLFEACAKEIIYEEKGKRVSSNIDFYSGFVYNMLQIPEEVYTPLFVLARMIGWLAHNIENKAYDGRIMRPATKYVGEIVKLGDVENENNHSI